MSRLKAIVAHLVSAELRAIKRERDGYLVNWLATSHELEETNAAYDRLAKNTFTEISRLTADVESLKKQLTWVTGGAR